MKAPVRYDLPKDDKRTVLRESVIEALNAIPHYFTSPILIQGLSATDLFSVNTLLGGAIEEQTVRILNELREIWDPNGNYRNYAFMRFPESFPDVRLVMSHDDDSPLIGIELKGWYLLSKEKEPSFRYKASANAMTEWDLLVCVPWALTEVLSGAPNVYKPFIEQAKFAADMRTFYWNTRNVNLEEIDIENIEDLVEHPNTSPYPNGRSNYSDKVSDDGGGNFGRIARISGLMDKWVSRALTIRLSGIEAKYWIDFLLVFKEGRTDEAKRNDVAKLVERIRRERDITSSSEVEWMKIYEILEKIAFQL